MTPELPPPPEREPSYSDGNAPFGPESAASVERSLSTLRDPDDALRYFAQFRHDVLEGLGWLQSLEKVMSEQGIPDDHLTWNHAAIDKQILDTYDVVHLDGWWHVFNK